MEFFIWYAVVGLFVSTIITWFQLARLPYAQVSPIGFFMSVVIWPIFTVAFIISIIKDGW